MNFKFLTLILFTLLTGCSAGLDLPEDKIIRIAIDRSAGVGDVYKLNSYDITNSYSRLVNGEEYVTIEYIGTFDMKDSWKERHNYPKESHQIKQSGTLSVVKRGNQWYF